eukprot:5066067-Pleurochrysis_carterae.AAC.1
MCCLRVLSLRTLYEKKCAVGRRRYTAPRPSTAFFAANAHFPEAVSTRIWTAIRSSSTVQGTRLTNLERGLSSRCRLPFQTRLFTTTQSTFGISNRRM